MLLFTMDISRVEKLTGVLLYDKGGMNGKSFSDINQKSMVRDGGRV